jgi:hypothetical protein
LANPNLSLKDIREDAIARIQDSAALLKRVSDAVRSSSPTFDDILMLQRAYLLNSELKPSDVRSLRLSDRLSRATESYIRGVEFVRRGDLTNARSAFQQSRESIRDFLHQNELIRYCESRLRSSTDPVDPALNDMAGYYVRLSDEELRSAIRSEPGVRELQRILSHFGDRASDVRTP